MIEGSGTPGYPNPWLSGKTHGNPSKNIENHWFSLIFQWILSQKPSQNVPTIRPIILNQSQPPPTSPDPICIEISSPKKIPKNMQNEISKKSYKSLKTQLSCLFEGLGPLPNCRSRFCGSNRLIFSSGNPMGTSLVTKQCSEKKPWPRIFSDNQGFG